MKAPNHLYNSDKFYLLDFLYFWEKMNNYFKSHIWYQKAYNNKNKVYNATYLQYKKDLEKYLDKFHNAKVLEIWCGMWKFTNFCSKIWVIDYTWIDIDDYFFEENKKDFPKFNFIKIWFQEYLKIHKNKFDIIFVSHVFEHLDEKERIEMVESIYWGLKENWIWINYMPNADSTLKVWNWRWTDITHKTIYNDMSFAQVVYGCNCNFKIENYNTYIWVKNFFRRSIHLFFRWITKIYFLGMWHIFPEFYTWEFINVLTKKWKN